MGSIVEHFLSDMLGSNQHPPVPKTGALPLGANIRKLWQLGVLENSLPYPIFTCFLANERGGN